MTFNMAHTGLQYTNAKKRACEMLEKMGIEVDENGKVDAGKVILTLNNYRRMGNQLFELCSDLIQLAQTDVLDYEQQIQDCYAKFEVLTEIKAVTMDGSQGQSSPKAIKNTQEIVSQLKTENITTLSNDQMTTKVASLAEYREKNSHNLH